MTDSLTVLKRTIEYQKEHIEILRRSNEGLRTELAKRKSTSLAGKFEFEQGSLPQLNMRNSSLSKVDWFNILHGAMVGTFIYLYLRNYEIIREFYF